MAPAQYNNGYYRPRKYQFKYGEKIYFECHGIYSVGSRNYVTCGDHGKWDHEIPSCRSKCSVIYIKIPFIYIRQYLIKYFVFCRLLERKLKINAITLHVSKKPISILKSNSSVVM